MIETSTVSAVACVQRAPKVEASGEEIRQRLSRRIEAALQQQDFHVTPLINIQVLDPPVAAR